MLLRRLQSLERIGLRGDRGARRIRAMASTSTRWNPRSPAMRPRACWLMTNFQNPLGSPCRSEASGAGRTARAPRRAADRGRRLRRAVFRRPGARCPPRPSTRSGLRDALLVVLQEPRARLPHRLGRRRAVRAGIARRKLTTTLNTNVPAQLAIARLSRTRRLRPPPAATARDAWPRSRPASSRRSRRRFRRARG